MKELLEVFVRPIAVFEGLPVRKTISTWLVPLILNTLLMVLLSWMVPHYVGREKAVRQAAQVSKMNEPQTAALVRQLTKPGNIAAGYVFLAVEVVLCQLVLAGALFAFCLMSSRPPEFGPVLAVVSLSVFAYLAVLTAGSFAVLASASDPGKLNSLNLLPTNPAAFRDPDSLGKGIYSLLGSLDLLVFAAMGLMAAGIAKVAGWRYWAGLCSVGGLWVFYLSVKTVVSLMF